MKKVLILSLLTLAAVSMSAQPKNHLREDGHHINRIQRAEQLARKTACEYRLDHYQSDDNFEFTYYSYDNRSRLIAIHDSVVGEYSVFDSISYNDRDQLVRISGWQLIYGTYKNVYYVDYTYDNNGNIASRTNYNYFSDEWNLGGVYNYTYNDQNQIVLSTLTMAGMMYQKVEYSYENNLLQEEIWYNFDGSGLSPDERLTYHYQNNQLVRMEDSIINNGVWVYNGVTRYEYDEFGNCTQDERCDYTGGVSNRNVYHYDYDMQLSNIVTPWTPEIIRPNYYNNVNPCVLENWYSVDAEHVLQYICDYIYTYGENTAGIASPEVLSLTISPNPAAEFVTIQGAEQLQSGNARLEVIDEQGRIVYTSKVVSQFSVRNFAHGCYIVRVIANGRLHTSKLMVE